MYLLNSIPIYVQVLFALFTFSEEGRFRIKLPEYNLTVVPSSCKSVITKIDSKSERYFKLHLKDCKGAMLFECFNSKDSTVLEKGLYISSLDLLKSYVYAANPTTGKVEVKVVKYYQPLKDGVWLYFQDGKVKRREVYKRGVLEEE